MEAALAAERDAAVARASEHGAYRTAASAFLASKNLLPEFDAWCEARGMPADAVGALVEVARAARHGPYAVMSDGRLAIEHVRDALDKLAAIAPGILDHSEG